MKVPYSNDQRFDVEFRKQAKDKLAELGIKWDRIVGFRPEKRFYALTQEQPVHEYFMVNNNQEVAYWTPLMSTLYVHGTPRTWGNELLAEAEVLA